MMPSPAKVLAQYLTDVGAVRAPADARDDDWPVTVGSLPPDRPNCVTVSNGVPRSEGRLQYSGERVVKPGVQIVVRGKDEPTAWDKGAEIEAICDGVGLPTGRGGNGQVVPVLVDSYEFVLRAAHVMVPMVPLGEEADTRRVMFSINAALTLDRVTPDNYKTTYGEVTPVAGDKVLGYHDGYLRVFDLSEFLGAQDSYVHAQSAAATVWTIVHNLGKYPNVTAVDGSGNRLLGAISFPNLNTAVLTFSVAFSGTAYAS